MAQNFLSCDRDQVLLLPPNVRDWLPGDHFAWFLLDSVEALELSAFYDAYRTDGHGRAAYEPSMMAWCSMPTRRMSVPRVGSSGTAAMTLPIG
jgi:hypothetical protein